MTINTAARRVNARDKEKSNSCYSSELIYELAMTRLNCNDSFMEQVGCTKRRITRSRLARAKLWKRGNSYDRREPKLNDINSQYESLKNQLTLIIQRLKKSQVGEIEEVDMEKPVSSFPFSTPQHSGNTKQTSQHSTTSLYLPITYFAKTTPDALPDRRASKGKQCEPSEEISLFRPPELEQTDPLVALLDRRSSTTSRYWPVIHLTKANPNSIKGPHECLEEISQYRQRQLRQTGPPVEHLKLTTNSSKTAPKVRPLKKADWVKLRGSVDDVENSDQSNCTHKTGEPTSQTNLLTSLGFNGGGIRREKLRTSTGYDRYTERPLTWVWFAKTNKRNIVGEGEESALTFHESKPVTAAHACRLKEQDPNRVRLSGIPCLTPPFFSLVPRILDRNENSQLTLKPAHANFVGRIGMPTLPWLQGLIEYFKYRHYDPGIFPYIPTFQSDFLKQVVLATTPSEPSNSPNYQLSRIATGILSSKSWRSRSAMTIVEGLKSRVGGKFPWPRFSGQSPTIL